MLEAKKSSLPEAHKIIVLGKGQYGYVQRINALNKLYAYPGLLSASAIYFGEVKLCYRFHTFLG